MGILAIVIACDWVVGAVSKNLIFNIPNVGQNQSNAVQALFKQNSDVLILGPSAANHHYDCSVIEKELGMTAYNAGRDGQNIIYAAMVLEGNLERYTPKIVVLDMSSVMMDGSWNSHLAQMYCYYGIEKSVDKVIDTTSDWKERLKLISNLYRYNNTFPWILQANLSKSKDQKHGYRPLDSEAGDIQPKIVEDKSFKVDSLSLSILNQMVSSCKKKNIRFVICDSPSFVISKGSFKNWLNNYCKLNSIQLLDYNNKNKFTTDPKLNYDMSHLNARGATLFTKDFCNHLKPS